MNRIMLSCLFVLFASCKATIEPVATGGSRADGVIAFAYSHDVFTIPQIDWEKVTQEAVSMCMAWGYESAQQFGEPRQGECLTGSGTTINASNPSQLQIQDGTCWEYEYTVSYQCKTSN